MNLMIIFKNSLILILIGTFVTLSGCGPKMRTIYDFTPPATPHGQNCITQCLMLKRQCQRLERINIERCQEESVERYETCREDNRLRRRADRVSCYKAHCSDRILERCEVDYRECYQNCGGKVRSETMCVANCDRLNK